MRFKLPERYSDEAEMIALTARLKEIAAMPEVHAVRVTFWSEDLQVSTVIYPSSELFWVGRFLPVDITHLTIEVSE